MPPGIGYGPNPLVPMIQPGMLNAMQQQITPRPSGFSALLDRPGVREGLLMAGLRLLASDRRQEGFGQALASAAATGIGAGRMAAQREEYEDLLSGAPPEMQAVMRLLGPEQGAALMAQQMMRGAPAPVTLSEGAALVDPVTGDIIAENVPDPERDIRNVGDALVDLTSGTPEVIYEAPEEGPDFGDVAALRNRYEANIAPYEEAAQAFRKMEVSATGEATPAKDIALVFNYMKAIDPGSTVREGEFATAQNAGSAWDIAGNLYNRLLTGQRLNAAQRQEFLNSAREQVATLLPQYQTVTDQYRSIAEANGFDPTQVLRNPFAGLNLATENLDPLGIRR